MRLNQKEKEFFKAAMALPAICPARIYSQKLYSGSPRREDLLDIEIFLRQISEHCQERWMLRRLYEDYQAKAGVKRQCLNDPTTQEQDRKAWKKTSVRIVGWCQNVRRRAGAIKRRAGFR